MVGVLGKLRVCLMERGRRSLHQSWKVTRAPEQQQAAPPATSARGSLSNPHGSPRTSVPFPNQLPPAMPTGTNASRRPPEQRYLHLPERQSYEDTEFPSPRKPGQRRNQAPEAHRPIRPSTNLQLTPCGRTTSRCGGTEPTRRTSFQRTSRWCQISLSEYFASTGLARTGPSP